MAIGPTNQVSGHKRWEKNSIIMGMQMTEYFGCLLESISRDIRQQV